MSLRNIGKGSHHLPGIIGKNTVGPGRVPLTGFSHIVDRIDMHIDPGLSKPGDLLYCQAIPYLMIPACRKTSQPRHGVNKGAGYEQSSINSGATAG